MSAPTVKTTPSDWVMRFLGGVSPAGHILDLACGNGRHMRVALDAGYSVTGIDRNLAGVHDLAENANVRLIEADLENGDKPAFADCSYDGVIVTNYLWRPILHDIIACVANDGILIYETFASGNEQFGKPSNPDFLLKPGELIAAASPRLTPIAYENITIPGSSTRMVQRICAVAANHSWLKAPPSC